MAEIKNDKEYKSVCRRVEELLQVVKGDTPIDNPNAVELGLLSDLVADYEEKHYPIPIPTLAEVLKERMYEMGINQARVAKLIGVSPSRVSEYISGKREPTLHVAREISRKMNIDPALILGV